MSLHVDAQIVGSVTRLVTRRTRVPRLRRVNRLGVLRQSSLVGKRFLAYLTDKRLLTKVSTFVGPQALPGLEALPALFTDERAGREVHLVVRIKRRVSLEPLAARAARVRPRVAVNGAVRLEITAIHEPLAADVAHEPLSVRRVSPTVSAEQARRLVRLATHVAGVGGVIRVRLLVGAQRRTRNERLSAERASEGSLTRMEHLVQT